MFLNRFTESLQGKDKDYKLQVRPSSSGAQGDGSDVKCHFPTKTQRVNRRGLCFRYFNIINYICISGES